MHQKLKHWLYFSFITHIVLVPLSAVLLGCTASILVKWIYVSKTLIFRKLLKNKKFMSIFQEVASFLPLSMPQP